MCSYNSSRKLWRPCQDSEIVKDVNPTEALLLFLKRTSNYTQSLVYTKQLFFFLISSLFFSCLQAYIETFIIHRINLPDISRMFATPD